MRLVSRSGLIATALAVAAIVAPNAQAGGLFSTGPDPKGADQQEAQSFLRIYSHPASTPTVPTPDRAATVHVTAPSSFDWGAAGIGAGGAFGLAMIVLGLALLVSQRRTRRSSRSAAIAR